jgi:hypothetical protein
MAEQGKVTGFRLPEEILKKLDKLQEMNIIKHRTDGVLKAVKRYYYEESYNYDPFLKMLSSIIEYESILENWDMFQDGNSILLVREGAEEPDIITKNGKSQAKILRHFGDKTMTITISFEDRKSHSNKV